MARLTDKELIREVVYNVVGGVYESISWNVTQAEDDFAEAVFGFLRDNCQEKLAELSMDFLTD